MSVRIPTLLSSTQFSALLKQREGSNVFFIFDFDGTLADYNVNPDLVTLTESNKKSLDILSEKFPGQLLVLSGRSFKDLERIFEGRNLWLTGEHGAESNFMQLVLDQKNLDLPELQNYLAELTTRFKGSFVESKKFSKVFHYRRAVGEITNTMAEQWARDINEILAQTHLRAHLYNKVIEIKPMYCSKKDYVTQLKKSLSPGTQLICFGDDIPDQEIFDQESSNGMICVGVGDRIERATYHVASPSALSHWLKEFSEAI